MDIQNLEIQKMPPKTQKGKYQSWAITFNQRFQRIKNLVKEISDLIFRGNILEVVYTTQDKQGITHKYRSILTNVTEAEFREFVNYLNTLKPSQKMDILEIKEIPTYIQEIPL